MAKNFKAEIPFCKRQKLEMIPQIVPGCLQEIKINTFQRQSDIVEKSQAIVGQGNNVEKL